MVLYDPPVSVLVQTSCIWEVTARKVGNVHPNASFANTSHMEFLISATAIAPLFDKLYKFGIGMTIDLAGLATKCLVGQNTNLGIILLLTPLASGHKNLPRHNVQEVLKSLTIHDAWQAFYAIRRASPGGLGDAPEQDVRNEPTVTLLEAMKLAADRDMVARQYANGFADVFDFGTPAFLAAFERFRCIEAAVIDCQFRWLAEFPDSLIARKNGPAVAEDVRQRTREVLRLGGLATAEGRAAGVALDKHLRSDGNKLNPGTTADLVTACLFVALRENKVTPSAPFRWQVEDWL
jgi:triphosphoribosyl-dephospho-CoA synthase